jgi:hypothetical protein
LFLAAKESVASLAVILVFEPLVCLPCSSLMVMADGSYLSSAFAGGCGKQVGLETLQSTRP